MVPLTAIREFLRLEAAGGIVLVGTAAAAILLANSPLSWLYDGLLATPVVVQVGALSLSKPLLLWVNDGLMAVFFFLVGLEIKREVLEGELSSLAQTALPPTAPAAGNAVCDRDDSSPSRNSRLISSPTRKKKTAISPSLTQSSSGLESERAPTCTTTGVARRPS